MAVSGFASTALVLHYLVDTCISVLNKAFTIKVIYFIVSGSEL